MMTHPIGTGLQPLSPDERDFSLGSIFTGELKLPPMLDFDAAPRLPIKNQDVVSNSDLCAAFACSSISEAQEEVELSPEYTFAQIKRLLGDYHGYGSDLRTPCKVAVNTGFIERKDSPLSLIPDGRDRVANWENWPDMTEKAAVHKKEAYFAVDGMRDTFDSIRAALWTYQNEKRLVLTGMMIRREWVMGSGIIANTKGNPISGHAFFFKGQRIIDGEPHLIAQWSNGQSVGNGGMFYFPRAVVNNEATFGNYMFRDLPKNLTKNKAIEKSIYARKGVMGKVWFFFNDFLNNFGKPK